MSDNKRYPTNKEAVEAVLAQFKFGSYVERRGLKIDDESYLYKLVGILQANIERCFPVLQPNAETRSGWDNLTFQEREYSSSHGYLEYESPILPVMLEEGWSLRRVHRELVSMLRALIALDPERLATYDVVIPSEEVSLIEDRQEAAADLAASELARLPGSGSLGHMLRYGLYIGLGMALEGRTSHDDLGKLSRFLAGELGAHDPLERPEYQMDQRAADFLKRNKAEEGK
jgi:hypothetical protein